MPTPDATLNTFGQHGLIGLVVLGLFLLIVLLVKEHGKERTSFKESLDKNTEVIRLFSIQVEKSLSAQFEARK